MSGVVRHINYVNRLAKLITLPGGKKIGDAVADAETALGEIEPDCIGAIDQHLVEIAAVAAENDPAAGPRLYALSNEIITLSWMVAMKDLGRAAYSLCELIDCSDGPGGCDRAALMVHIESLKLLRHPEGLGEAGVAAVLDGLAKVVARVRSAAPPAA
jgi:hypothetical protein